MTERKLLGKVAIVTGASRNPGRGIALMLGRLGARVVVHPHAGGGADAAAETARGAIAAGGEAELFAADLAEPRDVSALVERTL